MHLFEAATKINQKNSPGGPRATERRAHCIMCCEKLLLKGFKFRASSSHLLLGSTPLFCLSLPSIYFVFNRQRAMASATLPQM